MDTTSLFYAAVAGGAGGLAYSYYYKLLTMSTYLTALYHVGAGAAAGAIVVFSGGLAAPTDYTSGLVIAAVGYGGTDFLDSLFQKLAAPAPAPAA